MGEPSKEESAASTGQGTTSINYVVVKDVPIGATQEVSASSTGQSAKHAAGMAVPTLRKVEEPVSSMVKAAATTDVPMASYKEGSASSMMLRAERAAIPDVPVLSGQEDSATDMGKRSNLPP